MRTVHLALHHPGMTLLLALALLIGVQMAYGKLGNGVEFFPKVEPDYGQVVVHARGNLSLDEKDRLVRTVEERVLEFPGLKTVYTRAGEQPRQSNELAEDTIGVIQFEFADWQRAPPAHEIMDEIRDKTADIPGILVEVTAPRAGPPTGKPMQIQLSALDPDLLPAAAKKVAAILAARSDVRDVDDGLPLPGIDWRIEVDKARGREISGQRQHGRHRRAARHQRREGHRISPVRQRQGGRHPGALPARPAQPRPDRRAARPDAGRPCADRQLRHARAGAARRQHQPRRRQPRHHGVVQRRRGRAERRGAAGAHRANLPRPISGRA